MAYFKHLRSKVFLITWAVKILIPFIILGTRPTSTPSPRRDQLVWNGMLAKTRGILFVVCTSTLLDMHRLKYFLTF
jgi:hypothetical protein